MGAAVVGAAVVGAAVVGAAVEGAAVVSLPLFSHQSSPEPSAKGLARAVES